MTKEYIYNIIIKYFNYNIYTQKDIISLNSDIDFMTLYKECKIKKCLTINSLYTAFEANFDDKYLFDGETHDFWEMVYVKKGIVGVVADESIYRLSKGQLILHPPMEFHRIWSVGDENPTVIVISFGADWEYTLKNNIFSVNDMQAYELENILAGIHDAFIMENRAVSVCRQNDANAQLVVNRLEMFLLSVSACAGDVQNDVNVINRKYAEIVKILADNLDKNLNLDDIADRCNMSVSNLKKIFSKYSGMGIKHYYNEMKARQAAQYLSDGYSVKETAAFLGFTDQNYFSMFFKRIIGKTPTDYTKQL